MTKTRQFINFPGEKWRIQMINLSVGDGAICWKLFMFLYCYLEAGMSLGGCSRNIWTWVGERTNIDTNKTKSQEKVEIDCVSQQLTLNIHKRFPGEVPLALPGVGWSQ